MLLNYPKIILSFAFFKTKDQPTRSVISLKTKKTMVRIRLARRGRKKLAIYDVVVADQKAPRDGRFIERVGIYNPNSNPATIELDDERALHWVMVGAQPSDTVKAMLSYRGILLKKHLQIGVLKGAVTQEEADKRFEEWKQQKESKITGKVDNLAAQKESAAKARLEAERKVNEARAGALQKKVDEENASNEAVAKAREEAEKTAADAIKQKETPKVEEPTATEETPKVEETATTEEAPKAEETATTEEAPKAEETATTEEASKAEEEKKTSES